MRPVDLDIADAGYAVGACIGYRHPHIAGLHGGDCGIGHSFGIGCVGAGNGPSIAVCACLYGEIAGVEFTAETGSLGMAHDIAAYEIRFAEIALHPSFAVGGGGKPHVRVRGGGVGSGCRMRQSCRGAPAAKA